MSKQKPILEWLEMLPDGYREICKAEVNKEHAKSELIPSLKLAISSLAIWEFTKVGFDFMNLLCNSINYDNSINYEKLPPLPVNWQDLYKDKLPEETIKIKKPKNPNKKRDKLAVKIYLIKQADPRIDSSHYYSFEYAMGQAIQILEKIEKWDEFHSENK